MLTPKLVVTMISPETGRPRPTELDVLPEPLTAAEHGLMVGNPPPDDKWVHHGNWTAWPNIRWSLTHMDELRASGRISRGLGPAAPLPVAASGETGIDLDALALDDDVEINPSGGALAANPMMTAGLTRIGEAANRIASGKAGRGIAHATSGPCLQQNLVCVLEAE